MLSYTSDEDRSYGAAGMTIGLAVYRGSHLIASVSIDRDPAHILELGPDYFFPGSQEASAKATWGNLVQNYNYSVVMLLSNLLCRTLTAHGQQPEPDAIDQLRQVTLEEGRDACQLDEDEIKGLFADRLSNLTQVFSHAGVRSIAHDMASQILSRRTLSRMDILELLEDLRMI